MKPLSASVIFLLKKKQIENKGISINKDIKKRSQENINKLKNETININSNKQKKKKNKKLKNKISKKRKLNKKKGKQKTSLKVIRRKKEEEKNKRIMDKFLNSSDIHSGNVLKNKRDSNTPKRGMRPTISVKELKFRGSTKKTFKVKGYLKEKGLRDRLKGSHIAEEKIRFLDRTVLIGALNPDLIRKILRNYLHQFKFCYQKELAFNRFVLGTTSNLNFTISALGKVKNIKLVFKGESFSQVGKSCLRQVLGSISFPKPKGGGVVHVRQPLNFSKD